MRINKYIASCGVASRRKAEEIILDRRVKVNGEIVSELSFNIDENNQSDEQYDKLLAADEESTDKDIICSNCYTTYAEYRETGKLGCSKCYEAFEKQLKPILKNIYGYDEYIGKIPKKVEGDVYISKEIRILKEDLIRAVEKEEYEKAADIRDKIKHLQKCNE